MNDIRETAEKMAMDFAIYMNGKNATLSPQQKIDVIRLSKSEHPNYLMTLWGMTASELVEFVRLCEVQS